MLRYVLVLAVAAAVAAAVVRTEADRRSDHIESATRSALREGLYSGCEELTNPTRREVQRAFSHLELFVLQRGVQPPADPVTGQTAFDQAREAIAPINCRAYADHRTEAYYP